MKLIEKLSKLLKEYDEAKHDLDRRPGKYFAFEQHLKEEKIRGYSDGNISNIRNRIKDEIERAKSKDRELMVKFEELQIVQKAQMFIGLREKYVNQLHLGGFVETYWTVYFHHVPVEINLKRKIGTASLKFKENNKCEMDFIDFQTDEKGLYKGTYKRLEANKVFEFNLSYEGERSINMICSFKEAKYSNTYYGSFCKYDGTRIFSGRLIFQPLRKKLSGSPRASAILLTDLASEKVNNYLRFTGDNYQCSFNEFEKFKYTDDELVDFEIKKDTSIETETPELKIFIEQPSVQNDNSNRELLTDLTDFASEIEDRLKSVFEISRGHLQTSELADLGYVPSSLLVPKSIISSKMLENSVIGDLYYLKGVEVALFFLTNDFIKLPLALVLGWALYHCKEVIIFVRENDMTADLRNSIKVLGCHIIQFDRLNEEKEQMWTELRAILV